MARRRTGVSRQRSASDSESEKSSLDNEHGIFEWDAAADRRWTSLREAELRRGFSLDTAHKNKASVFVTLHSRSMVVVGVFFALTTIAGTVASCLYFESDLQGLVYPFISETARDMPQTGAFAFGLTITSMFMIICAVLQYGKVKRDLRESDVGAKRNLTALIVGIVAPPFLGLLACYDTKRALNTHRACVVVFFSLTMVYMLTILSIYHHLSGRSTLREVMEAYKKDDDGRRDKRRRSSCTASPKEIKNVKFSVKVKTIIALIFLGLTLFYLPIGMCMVSDIHSTTYSKDDVYVHAARAVCQHLAVVCIILFYGTFYYDFGELKFYLVHR
jgi:hypothetical protein